MMTGIDKKTGLLTRCRAKDTAHCPYHRAGSHDARGDADIQKFNEAIIARNNAVDAPELRKTAPATPSSSASRADDPLALHMSDRAIAAATESMSTAMSARVADGDYDVDGTAPKAATFAIDPRTSRYTVTLRYDSMPGQRDVERLKTNVMAAGVGSAFAGTDGVVLSAPHVEEKGPWGEHPADADDAGDDGHDGATMVLVGRVNTISREDARAQTIVGIANATGFPRKTVSSISGRVSRVSTGAAGEYSGLLWKSGVPLPVPTGAADEYRVRLTYHGRPIRVSGKRKADAVRAALSAMADVEKQRTALIESRLAG